MLVLSRKRNEKVVIPIKEGVIECVVVEIRGDKVRLGWQAPKEIPVHREEVFKAIAKQERERAEAGTT